MAIALGSSAAPGSPGAPCIAQRRTRLKEILGISGLLALGLPLARPGSVPDAVPAGDWLGIGGGVLERYGALYLSGHPQERDPARLYRLLVGDAAAPSAAGLIAAIDRDWRSLEVTVVDGWVLARTEARLCAMVYMIGGDPS